MTGLAIVSGPFWWTELRKSVYFLHYTYISFFLVLKAQNERITYPQILTCFNTPNIYKRIGQQHEYYHHQLWL